MGVLVFNMWVIFAFVLSVIKTFFLLAFVSWIVFMFVWAFFKYFNIQRRLYLAHRFFGRKYREKDVSWCIKAVNNGLKEDFVRKHLLLNNVPLERVEEVIFTFKGVSKELGKGGSVNGRFEEDNGKTKLPEI